MPHLLHLRSSLRAKLHRKSSTDVMEGAEPIDCTPLATYSPGSGIKLCTFACTTAVHAEAVLGLIPGVMGTQVGMPQDNKEVVRVVYDSHATTPAILEKTARLTLLDAEGTRPFALGPPEAQKVSLQWSPLRKLLEDVEVGGRIQGSAAYCAHLNSYCYGYGTYEDVCQDAAGLASDDSRILFNLWEQRRNTASTP
eukprot:EG_transcript_9501